MRQESGLCDGEGDTATACETVRFVPWNAAGCP